MEELQWTILGNKVGPDLIHLPLPVHHALAVRELVGWYLAGKLKSREDIVSGIENFPETLLRLFSGENFGKLILKVA